MQLPEDVARSAAPQLELAEKLSVQMLLMAPMCPMEKVLKHRAARGASHPCSHFRARWNRILENLSLNDSQQARPSFLRAFEHVPGPPRMTGTDNVAQTHSDAGAGV